MKRDRDLASDLIRRYLGDDADDTNGRNAPRGKRKIDRRAKKPPRRMQEWHSKYDWRESSKGNHVAIDCGEIVATVYMAKGYYAWQIALNRDDESHFVQNEYFEDVASAKRRAEEILKGANCVTSTGK